VVDGDLTPVLSRPHFDASFLPVLIFMNIFSSEQSVKVVIQSIIIKVVRTRVARDRMHGHLYGIIGSS
jgi:hypothetical protein